MRRDELEMLDHRVWLRHAKLAGHLDALGPRIYRGKLHAGLHDVLLGAVETPEEIEMPPRAAELAVGDRLKADVFLPLDDALDLAVLDRLQGLRRDLALGALRPRLMDRLGSQQAADVVGAKRRFHALHPHTSFAIS